MGGLEEVSLGRQLCARPRMIGSYLSEKEQGGGRAARQRDASSLWQETDSASPSLQNTPTWETPEYTQPHGAQGSGKQSTSRHYMDSPISMLGYMLTFPGPQDREGEFGTSSTFWGGIHSFIH